MREELQLTGTGRGSSESRKGHVGFLNLKLVEAESRSKESRKEHYRKRGEFRVNPMTF